MNRNNDESCLPYSRLLEALYTASLYEIRLKQFLHEGRKNSHNAALTGRADDIVSETLPLLMGKLINRYELHSAFLSLARYIRSFDDATFVVDRLAGPLTEKMSAERDHGEADAVLSCATAYTDLIEQCITVPPLS